MDSNATPSLADALNAECFCIGLDPGALREALETELGRPGLAEMVRQRCPDVFSATAVFVAQRHLRRMAEVVRAVESVVALPSYREQVLSQAPSSARLSPSGARSVFFGYDFHLAGDELGLIEINTNAGGAMLNAVLARAQRACCPAIRGMVPGAASAQIFEASLVQMFRDEWQAAGRGRPLRRIAIVDEAPAGQYLYPEFLLFQHLFEHHGIHAVVADPTELRWQDGALWHETGTVDLVYNRLTDFSLAAPASSAILAAYAHGAVVVTPHPQAHALYADKRNLALLTDPHRLTGLGVPPDVQTVLLRDIPRTEEVTIDNAERLWRERRRLFFKPAAGFGSRAAYRGDKITKRVWEEILAGAYVAQALRAPGRRALDAANPNEALKFDLRAYVYDGHVQWVAARLYQGQTTNFRTPGGGFAPVYATGSMDAALTERLPPLGSRCSTASSSPTASCG
jgi:hypothetical protein